MIFPGVAGQPGDHAAPIAPRECRSADRASPANRGPIIH
jgi:hypothetical protein